MKKLCILLIGCSFPVLVLAQNKLQSKALEPFNNLLGKWSLETNTNDGVFLQEFKFTLGLDAHILVYETKTQQDIDGKKVLAPFIHGTIMYDIEANVIRFSSTDKDGDLVTGTCTVTGQSITYHYMLKGYNVREVYTYVSKNKYVFKTLYDTEDEKNIVAYSGVMKRIK